ncbi:MAG TPA: hypothetical protein VF065_02010 [Ilumatobacter sp.]
MVDDLEVRLARYRVDLDAAVQADLARRRPGGRAGFVLRSGEAETVRSDSEHAVTLDLETRPAPDTRRRWPLVALAAAAVLILVGALVLSGGDEHESPAGPPSTELPRVTAPSVANGLIAYVGEGADATSDIYVMAPDGSGVRRLTATPELTEYAPAWSADGSRLAFLRTADTFHLSSPLCEPTCQLVIVDPSTGVETFAVNIPPLSESSRGTRLPTSLVWSPVGQAIFIAWVACGGCGPRSSIEADLETEAFTLNTSPDRVEGWSRAAGPHPMEVGLPSSGLKIDPVSGRSGSRMPTAATRGK